MSRAAQLVLPRRLDMSAFWGNPAACASGVFFIRYGAEILRDLAQGASAVHLANLGVFQLIAWGALFLLLQRSSPRFRTADIAVLMLISLAALVPDDAGAWIGLTLMGLFLLWRQRDKLTGDPMVRAAAAIMLALATHLFWGRLLFELITFQTEIVDAHLAAGLLALMHRTVQLDHNIVTTAGQQIAIYEGCTSFKNISLALLCFVSLTKLMRPEWRRSDLATAAALIAATVGMNSLRLFLMASAGQGGFDYWHTGTGSQLIVAGLSALIPIVCLWGCRKEFGA
jgi:exosortase/archaeosortase family protein